jgi:hypothetical protein
VTIAGDAGPAALPDRDWVQQASQHPDPAQRLALVVQHTSRVAARTAAIREVMRDAAATDPAVRQLLWQDDQRRYLTQQALVDLVIGAGPLRPGGDRDHAVATFFALVNSHGYQLLATQLGWSPADWQQWLTAILGRELLGISPPSPANPSAMPAGGTATNPGHAGTTSAPGSPGNPLSH